MPGMIASDKVEVLAQVDVLVIGAGSAGCCAAISSAQQALRWAGEEPKKLAR